MKVKELFENESPNTVANLVGYEHRDPLNGPAYFHSRDLDSLEGSPKVVTGNFYCNENNLTSLKGGPEIVHGSYNCRYNQLTSLEGLPREIYGTFKCIENYDLKSGFISILKMDHPPSQLVCDNKKVEEIINNHINNSDKTKRVKLALAEFIDAELEDWI